jgi:hypothetical protein
LLMLAIVAQTVGHYTNAPPRNGRKPSFPWSTFLDDDGTQRASV